MDCLAHEQDDAACHVAAAGVLYKYYLHTGRLRLHKDEIAEMIDQLPDNFRLETGESFLRGCFDKKGNHWGEHAHVEELLCLGLATGKISYIAERV